MKELTLKSLCVWGDTLEFQEIFKNSTKQLEAQLENGVAYIKKRVNVRGVLDEEKEDEVKDKRIFFLLLKTLP